MKTNKELLLTIIQNIDSFKVETTNRLDKLENKVDNLEKKVDNIDKRVSKLEKEMININHFIQRDADITECELNEKVKFHLQQTFKGYNITEYSEQLKTLRDPFSNNLLTDFDGLFLLQFKDEKKFPAKRLLVIVEAKRYIDTDKVSRKINQKHKLQEIIDISKNIEKLKTTTTKFQNTVKAHKLDLISDVYLYIGGPYWHPEAKRFIQQEKNNSSTIGVIEIAGERYQINDFASLAKGGKQKLSKSD